MERRQSAVERYQLDQISVFVDSDGDTPLLHDVHDFAVPSGEVELANPIDPAAKRELDRFVLDYDSASRSSRLFPVIPQSLADRQAWPHLVSKANKLQDLSINLADQLNRMHKESDHRFEDIYKIQTLVLGKEMVIRSTHAEMLTLARRNNGLVGLVPLVDINNYKDASSTGIKINGVSIGDFVDRESINQQVVPLFEFLVVTTFLGVKPLSSTVLEEQTAQYQRYPKLSADQIQSMPRRIYATLVTSPDVLLKESRKIKEPHIRETYQQAANIAKGMNDVRRRAAAILFNPADKDFPALEELTNAFILSETKLDRLLYLTLLGLTNSAQIPVFYQGACNLANGENRDFYLKLASAVKEFNENMVNEASCPTDEDIASILEKAQCELTSDETRDTFRSIADSVVSIRKLSPDRIFEVDPDRINWHDLVAPNSTRIQIGEKRTGQVLVTLNYNNEYSEELEVQLLLDGTQGLILWNFLEDPVNAKTAQIASFRDNLLLVSSDLLEVIKDAFKPVALPAKNGNVKRERFEDPIYKLRKEARLPVTTDIDLFEEARNHSSQLEAIPFCGYKKEITIPEDEILDKMLSKLSSTDAAIVKNALKSFNEKGNGGKFSRKTKARSKEPLYTLGIMGTSTGIRVLMRESGSEAGTQRFEIITVGYRQGIYKKKPL